MELMFYMYLNILQGCIIFVTRYSQIAELMFTEKANLLIDIMNKRNKWK